ncbi:hypothetical protein L6452_29055 [Arctium lappa]|uniref:Uncharacterized protein n=1 Tax=Arctium lappa TaxID=4217 RepID=A0ACB8ZG93_ARCLA|nr:hypothetical protein L6452_29055 [Arctium lappa]
MVFKHQGNMVFDFLVFDPSTCEKQYSNPDVEDQPLTESESEKEEKRRTGDDRCFSVPMKFARSNGLITKRISRQVIIRDETRRTWRATLNDNKMQIRLLVCRDFRVKNHLKIGDTCMFELIKRGEVLVFNFYNIGKKPIKNYTRVKKETNSTIKKATPSISYNQPYFTSTLKSCSFTKSILEESKEDDDPRPYFIGKLKSSSMKDSILYLPNVFARKNGLFNNGEIILKNGKDERSWIVELKNHKNKYCYIGRGWKDFRVVNDLKKGDCFKLQIVSFKSRYLKKPMMLMLGFMLTNRTAMADTPTHFFNFIRPPFNLNLSIPRSFLPNLNGGRCSKAILRRGGHEWPVDVTDGGFSGDRWRKCVKENGIQEFDFMVFKHQGNMVFDFLVFDPSTCEKQYPNLPDVEDQPLTESESEKEEKRRTGDDRCFVFKITPYYIKSSRLVSVPVKFARSNGLISKWISRQVIIRDETRRTWPATLRKTLNHNNMRIYLLVCREFRVKNHLKIGDTCMFELVQRGEALVFNFYNIGKKPIKNYTRVKETNLTIKKATPSISYNQPYFTSTLKSCSFTSSILYLPNKFAKKNGLFKDGEIILRNGKDERSWIWIVELKNQKNKYCYIGRGWKDFCVVNGLKERDCYKFQIVDKIGENLVVNFYALKNPSRLS